jgi:hypothetical protein
MTGTDARRLTRYDRWMYRTMNDPRARRLHTTRARRRTAVALHVALTAAVTAGIVLTFVTGASGWLTVAFAALLGWIPVMGFLNAMTHGLNELRPHLLDERQRAERGAVHVAAHRVSLLLLAGAFGAFLLAHATGLSAGVPAVPVAVTALAVLEAHWLLPTWIAALRTPDEPEADSGDLV